MFRTCLPPRRAQGGRASEGESSGVGGRPLTRLAPDVSTRSAPPQGKSNLLRCYLPRSGLRLEASRPHPTCVMLMPPEPTILAASHGRPPPTSPRRILLHSPPCITRRGKKRIEEKCEAVWVVGPLGLLRNFLVGPEALGRRWGPLAELS